MPRLQRLGRHVLVALLAVALHPACGGGEMGSGAITPDAFEPSIAARVTSRSTTTLDVTLTR